MEFLDEVSRTVSLTTAPRRIVCLVPSITETLFALGLGDAIIGVTDYCTHPPDDVARVAKVGGTKDPHIENIIQLAPDLVIVNDEENRQEDFAALTERGLSVYVTAPRTVADGIAMIERLGPVLGCQTASDQLVKRLRTAYDQVVTAMSRLAALACLLPYLAETVDDVQCRYLCRRYAVVLWSGECRSHEARALFRYDTRRH